LWVADQIRRYLDVVHPDLVPIVEGGRAAQREEEHLHQARPVFSYAAHDARRVVVAEDPFGPGSLGQGRLVSLDDSPDGARLPLCQQDEPEGEGQVYAVQLRPVVGDNPLQG